MATEAFVIAITTTGTREVQRDLSNIGSAGNTASKSMDQVGVAATRTAKNVDALRGSLNLMRNALVIFSFVRAISGFAELASTAVMLENKLTTITNSALETKAVMQALGETSIRTRTDLETNTDTFVRLARSTGSLKLTYQELIDLTRGIADTVHIAGASSQQAKRALMDFAEGLAAGSLQGRQLRAMVMQLPTLGDAIAKSFGLAGAQLMGFLHTNPGALNPTAIVKALQSALPGLDAMIGKTQVTIQQGFVNLHTKVLLFVQDMDAALQISKQVSDVLGFIGDHVSAFAKFIATLAGIFLISEVVSIVIALLTNFQFLYTVVNLLTGGLLKMTVALVMLPFRLAAAAVDVLVNVFTTLVGVGKLVVNALTTVFNTVQLIIGIFSDFNMIFALVMNIGVAITGLIASIITMIPLLVFMAATFGVVAIAAYAAGVAVMGFLAPLGQLATLADPLDGLKLSIKDVPGVFEAAFDTVVQNFPLVTDSLLAIWHDMVNGMKNSFATFVNDDIIGMPKSLPSGIRNFLMIGTDADKGSYQFMKQDNPTNTAGPVLNQLKQKFAANVMKDVLGLRGTQDEGGNSATTNPLLGTPNVAQGKPLDETNAGKIASATAALENFLKQVSPYAAAQAKLADFEKVIVNAIKAHVDIQGVLNRSGFAGMTLSQARAEVEKRLMREVDGVGNATLEYRDKLKLLNEDATKYGYTAGEVARQQAKLKIAFLDSDPTNLANGLASAKAKMDQMLANKGDIAESVVSGALTDQNSSAVAAIQIDALNTALADGTIKADAYALAMMGVLKTQKDLVSGEKLAALTAQTELMDKGKIAAEALGGVYEKFNAGQKFLIQIQAINDAMRQNPALIKEGTLAIRDLQIQLLSTQTDALSGFQRGMLEASKDMNDFASTAAGAVKDALNDLTDALTTFFTTGKFSFKKLEDDMLGNLSKLAVQQVFTGPLSSMMAGGASGGGDGVGGILSSIFGGGGMGSILGGGQLGSSASNAMWVQMSPAGGITGALGGSSGGMGSLFSKGGFFSNLFNGGGGAGSTSSGILDALGGIGSFLGFAGGGDMTVGGQGGTDSQMLHIKATPGEVVSVRRPGDAGKDFDSGRPIHVDFHVHGVQDADSFQRSQGQIVSGLGAMLQQHMARG